MPVLPIKGFLEGPREPFYAHAFPWGFSRVVFIVWEETNDHFPKLALGVDYSLLGAAEFLPNRNLTGGPMQWAYCGRCHRKGED